MLPTLAKNPKLLAKSRLVDAAKAGRMAIAAGAIRALKLVQHGD